MLSFGESPIGLDQYTFLVKISSKVNKTHKEKQPIAYPKLSIKSRLMCLWFVLKLLKNNKTTSLTTSLMSLWCLYWHLQKHSVHQSTQLTFTFSYHGTIIWTIIVPCSKSRVETPQKGVKYVHCKLWTYFTSFSTVFIIDFEQVNFKWVMF